MQQRENFGFSQGMTTVQPGLDVKKWDLIAVRLNKSFHAIDNDSTPYFFYDGDECHSLFMSWYYNPSVNHTGIASEIQPIIDEAVKVYEANLKEYWRQYTQVPSVTVNAVNDVDGANDSHVIEHSPNVSSTDTKL